MTRILLILFLISIKTLFSQNTDTIKVYFDINEYEPNNTETRKIIKIEDTNLLNYIEIHGYTDFLGTTNLNNELSKKRCNAVKKILETKVDSKKIKEVNAHGIYKNSDKSQRQDDNDRGIAAHRVVFVILHYLNEEEKIEIIEKEEELTQKEEIPEKEELVIDMFPELNIEEFEIGNQIVLKNIQFFGGTHRIKQGSIETLSYLLRLMQDNPALKIRIEGHICCHDGAGDGYDFDAKDNRLSTNRARAVYDYLVNNGISPDRLKYLGYGGSRKLYPEERTTAEQEANRRVEIVILEK